VIIGGLISGKIGDARNSDIGALWCFKESDGSLLWRYRNPWRSNQCRFGITATPIIEGDRVCVIGQLGDVLCFDVKGLANGNDGPFKEEQDL
jgi:outer membrane protein assembly factor BamB